MTNTNIQNVVCTYDDYDKYMELFQRMTFKAMGYAPSMEDLNNVILPNLGKFVVMLLWIDETGEDTESNKESRSIIRKVLTEHLILVESFPEVKGEEVN